MQGETWDMAASLTNRRSFQVLKYHGTSSFLPSLTSLQQPGGQQEVFEERAGTMEGKGDFQQCHSMRARHLTCHMHLEKPPLPPQL